MSEVLTQQCSEILARACFAAVGEAASFAEMERELHARANEAVRLRLEQQLQEIADAQGERLIIDGKLFRRHQAGVVKYHSLCGELRVNRWSYREVGVRNGPAVVPLDLETKSIARSTPALSYGLAEGYALGSTRQYESMMKSALRVPPPRATLERLANYLGRRAAENVQQIEAVLREEEVVPREAHAVVVSLDRTSVAMAEERPANQPPNSPRKRRTKPYERTPPPPFDVQWRMPYVGSVCLVDRAGETMTRRYHATVAEGPGQLVTRLMADVVAYRGQRELNVVVLQDGAPELWNLLRPALRRARIRKWTEILDRFHVNERLAATLEILVPDRVERHAQYQRWQTRLDRNPRTPYLLSKWLGRAQLHKRNAALATHASYFLGNEVRMKYAAYLKRGFPIASGVIEGTCKSLVNRRAKGSGQRWKQEGLTAALTLRAILLSDRLPAFWSHFAQIFHATVSCAA